MPAGVEPEVVTLKVIVAGLFELGVNLGFVEEAFVMTSVDEVNDQVTPVGVPPDQVSFILSLLVVNHHPSDNVIV